MKILYVTDLHGDEKKYNKVLEIAIEENFDAIINGGDMLPKDDVFFYEQNKFINGFLTTYFNELKQANIQYYCMLGNDDMGIVDRIFNVVVAKYTNIHIINHEPAILSGSKIQIFGINLVKDYPFRLKDRCRLDSSNDVPNAHQIGTPLMSTGTDLGDFIKFKVIQDYNDYLKRKPTIECALEGLPQVDKEVISILVTHQPPAHLGLDVCRNKDKVGSDAVYRYIAQAQPSLSLHGHIHESYFTSGFYANKINNTVCIQPGQDFSHLTYVDIEINGKDIKHKWRNIKI